MLVVVVATGNHFFFDAVLGGLVAVLGAGMAALSTSPVAAGAFIGREPAVEKLAA